LYVNPPIAEINIVFKTIS